MENVVIILVTIFYVGLIVGLNAYFHREARRLSAIRLELEERQMKLEQFFLSTFHMHAEVLVASGRSGRCLCSVCQQARTLFNLPPMARPPSHST